MSTINIITSIYYPSRKTYPLTWDDLSELAVRHGDDEHSWCSALRCAVREFWHTLGFEPPSDGPVLHTHVDLLGAPVEEQEACALQALVTFASTCRPWGARSNSAGLAALVHPDALADALAGYRRLYPGDAAPCAGAASLEAEMLVEVRREADAGDASARGIVDALAAADRPAEAEAQRRRIAARLFGEPSE